MGNPVKAMTDMEYRKLAILAFPMLEHLLSIVSRALQDLDNQTYDSRIVRTDVKKGKKTVAHISVTPLSQDQIYSYLDGKGYIFSIAAVLDFAELLYARAWPLDQVLDFIHRQPEELQENIWLPDIFAKCVCDSPDNRAVTLTMDYCIYAIQHCYQFMHGDGIMDKVNSIFGYVAVQACKILLYCIKQDKRLE